MRAPAFWNIKHGRDAAFVLRAILWPLSLVYDFVTQERLKAVKPLRLAVPVVSVGNLTLGGTGKTPLVQFAALNMRQKFKNVAIISRGYKGKLKGPVKVDPRVHSAEDVGDEPLMLSKYCNVYVGQNRAAAAKLAVKKGAKAIILDDAHQNPSVEKDLAIVVVDGGVGFGNGFIFPSGPLREKPKTGLFRANAIVWIGDKSLVDMELAGFGCPRYFAKLVPEPKEYTGKYMAFCGIGRPEKFEATLKELGVDLVGLIPFADHHQYVGNDLQFLRNRAEQNGAKLITTEKDLARLSPDQRQGIDIVKIHLEFEKPDEVLNLLLNPSAF